MPPEGSPARGRQILLGLLALLGVGGGLVLLLRGREEVLPPPPAHVEVQEGTYALLVGCTEYPALRASMSAGRYERKVRLLGSTNDVEMLAFTLRRYLGVPAGNITTLAGWPEDAARRPTRANILAALGDLAARVTTGDRVVFHFSGHGTQFRDDGEDGEAEPDGLDEILLPADAASIGPRGRRIPNSISDDELRARLRAIREAGATVWASLDCCHAGTMTRGIGTRTRRIDPVLLGVPPAPAARGAAAREPAGQALAAPGSGIVAFYAVQSYQRAPEKILPRDPGISNRRWHGLFTFALVRTLMRYGGGQTFRELEARLLDAYASLPYDAATPFAEGDLGMYVARGGRALRPAFLLEAAGDGLFVDAGGVQRLGKGAVLAVFAAGRLDEAGGRLGTVEIVEPGLVRSRCEAADGGARVAAAARRARLPVVVEDTGPQAFHLLLAVTDEAGALLPEADWPAALRERLADAERALPVRVVPPAEAEWALRLPGTPGGDWRLERLEAAADRLGLGARVDDALRAATRGRAGVPFAFLDTPPRADTYRIAGTYEAQGLQIRVRFRLWRGQGTLVSQDWIVVAGTPEELPGRIVREAQGRLPAGR